MERTTIMADRDTLARLRRLARSRRMSFSALAREALDEKAASYLPKPTSLGAGQSSSASTAATQGGERQPPRSWR
jgi:predicted transcriptional regulator